MAEHSGQWMEQVAQGWLVMALTNSPLALGMVEFMRDVPRLFFPFLGGIAADRMDRKYLLIGTFIAMAMSSFALAFLVIAGLVQLWHILAVSFFFGVITSFNHPVRATLIPNLVPREDLLNAISLDSASVNASKIIASPIAGAVAGAAGVTSVFGLRGVGCLAALALAAMMKVPSHPNLVQASGLRKELADEWRYLKANKTDRTLLALYLIPIIFSMQYVVLLPIFARDVLKGGPEVLGLMVGAGGLGALLGTVALASLGDFSQKGQLLLSMPVLLGGLFILFALSRWLALSLVLMVGIGALNTGYMTLTNVLVQSLVPDELRGRVMSLREVALGFSPLGSLLLGVVATLVSAPFAIGLMGVICAALGILSRLLLPYIRRLA